MFESPKLSFLTRLSEEGVAPRSIYPSFLASSGFITTEKKREEGAIQPATDAIRKNKRARKVTPLLACCLGIVGQQPARAAHTANSVWELIKQTVVSFNIHSFASCLPVDESSAY